MVFRFLLQSSKIIPWKYHNTVAITFSAENTVFASFHDGEVLFVYCFNCSLVSGVYIVVEPGFIDDYKMPQEVVHVGQSVPKLCKKHSKRINFFFGVSNRGTQCAEYFFQFQFASQNSMHTIIWDAHWSCNTIHWIQS